eukprot:416316-Rhodomonas_salina.4
MCHWHGLGLEQLPYLKQKLGQVGNEEYTDAVEPLLSATVRDVSLTHSTVHSASNGCAFPLESIHRCRRDGLNLPHAWSCKNAIAGSLTNGTSHDTLAKTGCSITPSC